MLILKERNNLNIKYYNNKHGIYVYRQKSKGKIKRNEIACIRLR
jgi:hypothetical protein